MALWYVFGFVQTIREEGIRKALHDFWPLLALVGLVALAILTHLLGLW